MQHTSMTTAIRATIPLLTAPLAALTKYSANRLDGLHVALMSTLSTYLSPAWPTTTTTPSFDEHQQRLALARALTISYSSIPSPMHQAAEASKIDLVDWITAILAHYHTDQLVVMIDPGMVAVRCTGEARATVYWSEPLSNSASTSPITSRASSPGDYTSTSSSSSTSSSHTTTARRSRIPSVVQVSERRSKVPVFGSPRSPKTPQSFQGFQGFGAVSAQSATSGSLVPSAPWSVDADVDAAGWHDREPSWMAPLLEQERNVGGVGMGRPAGMGGGMVKDSRSNSIATAVPAHYGHGGHRRGDSVESIGSGRGNATSIWAPGHHAGSKSMSSNSSSASSGSGSPTGTSLRLGAPQLSSRAPGGGLYSELSLNMSQLSLSSSGTSTSSAPSLLSAASTASLSSISPTNSPVYMGLGGLHPQSQSSPQVYNSGHRQLHSRAASPSDMFNPTYALAPFQKSLTAASPVTQQQLQKQPAVVALAAGAAQLLPADDNDSHLVDGLYYHFDELDQPSPSPSSFTFASASASDDISPTLSMHSSASSGSSSSGHSSTGGGARSSLSGESSKVRAYVAHDTRRTVTEYECGKVGVLGGAVMLGVPSKHKRESSKQMQPQPQVPTRAAVGLGAGPAQRNW